VTLIDQFAIVANAYCTARDLSVARVSTIVFNDGSKLGDLMSGAADVTTRRYEKALQWFSDNWPDNTGWPAEVARPETLQQNDGEAPSAVEAGSVPSQAGAGHPLLAEPAE